MEELRFKIGAYSPETIPMVRLAEYMATLATLLGNDKSVHFVRLDPGSVALVHSVDTEDQPKVNARLVAVKDGNGPYEATKAFRKLDSMLANDNATGTLTIGGNQSVIIDFPGKNRPQPIDYGAFSQLGSFDGVPIKIGGKEEQVPIHLQETSPAAFIHTCHASRSMAREIAGYLFETPIRVHGTGRWRRENNGQWTLLKFNISDFEVLDDAPLTAVVAALREVPGNAWLDVSNPLETLTTLRSGRDGLH